MFCLCWCGNDRGFCGCVSSKRILSNDHYQANLYFQKNVGEAVQNGTFERDIPLCLARESMIIMVDPNLSENEKKVQAEKFSQEYYAKLEK